MLPSFSPVCGWGKLRRLLFCIWCSTIIPSSYYVCTFSEECEGNLQQQFPWEVLKRTFNRAQGKPTIRRNGITKYLLQLKKKVRKRKQWHLSSLSFGRDEISLVLYDNTQKFAAAMQHPLRMFFLCYYMILCAVRRSFLSVKIIMNSKPEWLSKLQPSKNWHSFTTTTNSLLNAAVSFCNFSYDGETTLEWWWSFSVMSPLRTWTVKPSGQLL